MVTTKDIWERMGRMNEFLSKDNHAYYMLGDRLSEYGWRELNGSWQRSDVGGGDIFEKRIGDYSIRLSCEIEMFKGDENIPDTDELPGNVLEEAARALDDVEAVMNQLETEYLETLEVENG